MNTRLSAQQQAVGKLMFKRKWWTLQELNTALRAQGIKTNGSASVSARVRCMRQGKYDGTRHKVEKKYISRGLWKYRLKYKA